LTDRRGTGERRAVSGAARARTAEANTTNKEGSGAMASHRASAAAARDRQHATADLQAAKGLLDSLG